MRIITMIMSKYSYLTLNAMKYYYGYIIWNMILYYKIYECIYKLLYNVYLATL